MVTHRLLEVVIKVDEIRHRDAVEFVEQGHGLTLLCAYICPSVQHLSMQVDYVPVAQNDIIRIDSRIATIFNDSNH